jgi:hypothetical protein
VPPRRFERAVCGGWRMGAAWRQRLTWAEWSPEPRAPTRPDESAAGPSRTGPQRTGSWGASQPDDRAKPVAVAGFRVAAGRLEAVEGRPLQAYAAALTILYGA